MIADAEAHTGRNRGGFARWFGGIPGGEAPFDEGYVEARGELERKSSAELGFDERFQSHTPPHAHRPRRVRDLETARLEKSSLDERARTDEKNRTGLEAKRARADARRRQVSQCAFGLGYEIVSEIREREAERRTRRA